MSATPYRFNHFARELLVEDMAFLGGPEPGSPFPDFDLPTVEGGRVSSTDLFGERPVLMEFSSLT